MKAKPKRKPSKLESQLRLSIKFAKLEARINALEAEVLRLGRKDLITGTGAPSANTKWLAETLFHYDPHS